MDLAPRPDPSQRWTIYGASSWCGPCRRVKAFLNKKNEEYKFYELGNDIKKVREFVKTFSYITGDNATIPMVFHYGKFIKGGCDGTIAYYKTL